MANKSDRLLAAIMFTDMVGYTALMQENEELAKKNRDRHRQVQKDAVERHQGEILQYYGDGTLIIFNSAIQSVACAVEIQQELQKEPKIPLRVGLHTGDIVYDDEGVYGDGVNLASRIENLAVSGSILISDKLADEIKNQPRFSSQSLGFFQLKNVKQKVEVFALSNEGLTVPDTGDIDTKKQDKDKTIAVLPFVNMSSDPENEYFSDGITEELLNVLSKVEGLLVTARTSSFAFKGQNIDIREIGKQLGVKSVLEGSVRKAGNKVRVTAQLINTADGYHVWSETFDRQLEDIFEIQDEISMKIANRMRENLDNAKATEKLAVPSTDKIEAYNLYLKALYQSRQWSLTGLQNAIEYLEQALKIDPGFALAYALLSQVYLFYGASGKMSPEMAYRSARKYGEKANEMDDSLAETQLALANSAFWGDWDWEPSFNYINKAIELNPSYADAYQFKAIFLMVLGNTEEAETTLRKALQLDPFSAATNVMLAGIFFFARQLDKSMEQVEKTLTLSPGFPEAVNMKGWLLVNKGLCKEAVAWFEEARNIPGNEPEAVSGIVRAYAKMGEMGLAKGLLDGLLDMENNFPEFSISYFIAAAYAEMKDKDNMFVYLNKAADNKEGSIFFFKSEQVFDPYHSDSRFDALIKRIGLPVCK